MLVVLLVHEAQKYNVYNTRATLHILKYKKNLTCIFFLHTKYNKCMLKIFLTDLFNLLKHDSNKMHLPAKKNRVILIHVTNISVYIVYSIYK